MIGCRIRVIGKVQGVFFRVSAKEKAVAMGLTGWVRNDVDGSVLIEINGPKKMVERFIQWCKEGPSASRVDAVEVEEMGLHDFENFQITY